MSLKLDLKSVSSSNFKILFDVLREILVRNISIIFTKEYMMISEVDNLKKVMVYLKIDSTAFQKFYCKDSFIKIGVDPCKLFKIIKVSSTSDTISFIIKEDSPDNLIVRFENSIKKKCFESRIKLLNLNTDTPELPDLEYNNNKIILQSSELHNIFKHLNSLGDNNVEIDIKKINSQIIFNHKGNFSDQKMIYHSIEETEEENNTIFISQGTFDLKYLLLLSKSHKINVETEIYIENNMPLMLLYRVADLGELKLILSENNQTLEEY